jgi:hypothetical protein
VELLCKRCGVHCKRDGGGAKYCLPCARKQRPRIAPKTQPSNWDRKGKYIDGVKVCRDCDAPIPPLIRNGRSFATSARCSDCWRTHVAWWRLTGGLQAIGAVSTARRKGEIPHPSTLACTDCGVPAECYDHRDYARPLDVQPVCRSCNAMRGPAKPISRLIVSALLLALADSRNEAFIPIKTEAAQAV